MDAQNFLENYYNDLEYQFNQSGIDSVNYNSCGTDYFKTEVEYVAYMEKLKLIIELKGNS